jgi:hypothetical protein
MFSQGAAAKSTEMNVDAAGFNRNLAIALTRTGDPSASVYTGRADFAAHFAISMFDSAGGKFWTGTTAAGAINQSSVPLDAQILTYLALGVDPNYSSSANYAQAIAWAEQHLVVTDAGYTGFTYSTGSTPRVWFEGVGSSAVEYTLMGSSANAMQARELLATAQQSHPNGDGMGIVATSSDGLVDSQLGANYDARLAVAPTAWAVLSKSKQPNPFTIVSPNQWALAGGGAWSSPTSWTDGVVPDGNTAIARLWLNLSSGVVDLQATDRTVKKLIFENAAANYNIVATGGGKLVMQSDEGNSAIQFEATNSRDHTISAGLRFNSNTDIVAWNNTLTLSGQQDWNGHTVTVQSGMLRFNGATATNISTGSTLAINGTAVVQLAGNSSPTSFAGAVVSVVNNSTASAGVVVSGARQRVGTVDGTGSVRVEVGGDLTANHIIQGALIIGGTMANPAFVTIDASDASGNPLSDDAQGLVLANSLATAAPFVADSIAIAGFTAETSLSGNGVTVSAPAPNGLSSGSNRTTIPEPSAIILWAIAAATLGGTTMGRRRVRRGV